MPGLTSWRSLARFSVGCGWILVLAAPATAMQAPAPATRNYPIDRVRSSATFAVQLIWWQTIQGRFDDVEGRLELGPDHRVQVRARIAVGSVRVHPAHYRRRLLAKRFFDAATYPDIAFVSTPLPVTDLRSGGHVHGALTLHGVTRPLSLQIIDATCPGPGLAGCVYHLQGWLNRTRYGMSAHRTLVSTRVQLDLIIHLSASSGPSQPEPVPARRPASSASSR